MVFPIVQTGDPVLRQVGRRLDPDEVATPFVQELIASMRLTMYDAPGVGLAAPQVGESLQVTVVEDDEDHLEMISPMRRAETGRVPLPFTVLVNPVLTPVGDEMDEFFEGCLSVEGYAAIVARYRRVRVAALDGRGRPFELEVEGWPARILQHEIDHLYGILYLDRMDTRTFTTNENHGRWWKARPAADVRAAVRADVAGAVRPSPTA